MSALTEKIIELVPDYKFTHCMVPACDDFAECDSESHFAPIALADVLRAIGTVKEGHGYLREPSILRESEFTFSLVDTPDIRIDWNLSTDLDGQSDETKAFINKVLGVEETEV